MDHSNRRANLAGNQDRLSLAFEREVAALEIGDVCDEWRTHRFSIGRQTP
jgi:hypothetical protein